MSVIPGSAELTVKKCMAVRNLGPREVGSVLESDNCR